jgi:hypothetical protein
MLKRYTHHQTAKLVHKIDGPVNKQQKVLAQLLVPYPATVQQQADSFVLKLLDFDNLQVTAPSREEAAELASTALLRRLCTMRMSGKKPPVPDQYLDPVDEASLIMVTPLKLEDEVNEIELTT